MALTLVDSLDALLLIGRREDVKFAVELLREGLQFDKDVKVHLFEVVIRVLGGLISAHLLITRDPEILPSYDGILLLKAVDLADRMLPAFDTPSGLPALFVNLKTGQVNDTNVTCTACAGTLLLEFGLLSHLTKDPKYMEHAHRCARTIHGKRSKLGLVGSYLDINSHEWTSREATIGPGIDSYYEYLLKAFLMFGEQSYLDMFLDIYSSSMFHMQLPTSVRALSFLADVNIDSGRVTNPWLSSLGAFWPGMQAIIGQEKDAVQLHSNYSLAWKTFGWMPEAFSLDLTRVNAADPGYNLRPEHVESTFLLHSITGRDEYLELGSRLLDTLEKHNRVKCGFSSISDVATGQHQDLQESFFLSETLKYFYLLFSNSSDFIDHFVLSTEGHIMPILQSPPEGVFYGDPDDEYEDIRDEDEVIRIPNSSSIPSNCRSICSQLSPNEQKGRIAELEKSFPLLRFSSEESTLLRRRRCHACLEVTARMKDQPNLSEGERAKMMKLPLDTATGVLKSPPILAQAVCTVVQGQRTGSASCSILRPLTQHDNQFGVPVNAVVFNLVLTDATDEEISASKNAKEAALKAAGKMVPNLRPLLIAVGGFGDQMSLVFLGRPAEFGPPQNTIYEPCLEHILEEGRSSLQTGIAVDYKQGRGNLVSFFTRRRLVEADKLPKPPPADLLEDSYMCKKDVVYSPQNHPSSSSCSWLDTSSSQSRLCEKPFWEEEYKEKEDVSRGCLDGTSVVGKFTLADPPDGCSTDSQPDLKGSIAIVHRGNCAFMQKVHSMQELGAVGVVIVNRPGLGLEGEALGSMGADGTNRPIFIPSVLLSRADGERLIRAVDLSAIGPRPLLGVLTIEPLRVRRLPPPPSPEVQALLTSPVEDFEARRKAMEASQVKGPEVRVELKVPRIEMIVPGSSSPFVQAQFINKGVDPTGLLNMLVQDGKVAGLLSVLGQAQLVAHSAQMADLSQDKIESEN